MLCFGFYFKMMIAVTSAHCEDIARFKVVVTLLPLADGQQLLGARLPDDMGRLPGGRKKSPRCHGSPHRCCQSVPAASRREAARLYGRHQAGLPPDHIIIPN